MSEREPGGSAGRQAGVTDRTNHASHELLDVAAFAAGDLTGPQRDDIVRQVEACTDCQALLADLTTLTAAIHADPPAVPLRTADFHLDESDVARLANPWRRFTGWLRGPRGAVTRPVAAGLATVGVAAILLSSVPSASPASQGAAPEAAGPSAAAAPMLQASDTPRDAVGAAAENDGGALGSPSVGTQDRSYGAETSPPTVTGSELESTAPATPSTVQPLMVVGVVLVGAAVVLLLARPVARRLD